jgi:hypothetical protein
MVVTEARSALSDAMHVNLESISCEGITRPGIHILSGAMHVNLESISSVPPHKTRNSHGRGKRKDADGLLGWCMVQWYECAWRYDMVGTCGIHLITSFSSTLSIVSSVSGGRLNLLQPVAVGSTGVRCRFIRVIRQTPRTLTPRRCTPCSWRARSHTPAVMTHHVQLLTRGALRRHLALTPWLRRAPFMRKAVVVAEVPSQPSAVDTGPKHIMKALGGGEHPHCRHEG